MALTHLDAGVIIGFLDGNDAHHSAALQALTDALHGGDRLAIAASALAECLVAPARTNERAVRVVLDLIERLPVSVIPADVGIATTAARLRARHAALRLPDALVIATAIEGDADRLITTDLRWPTAKALRFKGRLDRL